MTAIPKSMIYNWIFIIIISIKNALKYAEQDLIEGESKLVYVVAWLHSSNNILLTKPHLGINSAAVS